MRTINISIMPNPFCMWEKHYNEFDSKMIADELYYYEANISVNVKSV